MTHDTRLDVLARGWRGRLFAALVALIAGLPGLLALPVLDRDEARFVQSTVQMLETGDFIGVKYQEQPHEGEPLALHWLQAASVSALSSAEARQIWAYRVPSLLAAMLAAMACAWGAEAFFGAGAGAIAGAILGGCLILSTEAGIGKTDALLCATVTMAMAALGRLYGAAGDDAAPAGIRIRLLFWAALVLAVLDKGFAGPMIAGLTGLALWAWDRRAPWARSLGWAWGLILLVAATGPWLAAVTVRSDGLAWVAAPASDLAGLGPGLRSPIGLHLLVSPLLLFPFAALLPAALVEAWKARSEPGVRFALGWLIPSWLVLEAEPTRQIHQVLPLYGALAWLAAAAVTRPLGRLTRLAGAALSILAAGVITAGVFWLTTRYGDKASMAPAIVAGLLTLVAGLAGALVMAPRWRLPALAGAGVLGIAAHGVIAAALAPSLEPLWVSRNVVAMLDRSGLNPQIGLIPGPVTVVGYAEPSLVFMLGTETDFGDQDDAVEAISEGRPVVIGQDATAAFQQALSNEALKASLMGRVAGLDYVDGQAAQLNVYRSDSPPPADAANDADRPDETATPPMLALPPDATQTETKSTETKKAAPGRLPAKRSVRKDHDPRH